MERMRALRAKISHIDGAERFRDLGVDVFIGEGRFVAADAVDVGGQRLRFRRAVVATGARPAAPPIPGCGPGCYLTNETIFTLTDLPSRLGVVGGGPIGCELSQSFATFGSRVTLFDMAPQILPREDLEAAAIVQESMERDGVEFELGVKVLEVEQTGEGTVVHFERDGNRGSEVVDELLLAVGRAPNVEGLGLEAAGVDFDRRGVAVDDRLRTSNKRIYAIGDVASKYKFTHAADAQARIAIQNSLFFGRAKASDLVIPWCTYTSPEVAHVGLTEAEAKSEGAEVETLTVPLSEVDRALLDGETDGFLRLHYQKGKDRILGGTLVAEHAGDMIGELSLAITAGVGLGKLSGTIPPYPTQAEVFKKAADGWRRTKLTPTVQKVFSTFFKIFR